jgi:hypothetical protein
MSEYEYMDLFLTLVERSENAGVAFLTVVSSYLIIAYLVGEKLTKGQVILVSGLFFCFAFAGILAQISQINLIIKIDRIMYESFPESPLQTDSSATRLNYLWLLLEFLVMLASLHFMWSIRRPKRE